VPSTTANGVQNASAVTDNMLGVCIDLIAKNGLTYRQNPDLFDGTVIAAVTGDKYTAASDNLTDKKIAALVMECSNDVILSAILTAAMGTTAGSDKVMNFIDLYATDPRYLDEASITGTWPANFRLVPGVASDDPTDPACPNSTVRVLCKLVEAQYQKAQ